MLMQVLLEPWKWEPPGSWVTLKRSLSYVIYYMFPMARCLPPCIIHGLWIALKLLSHNWVLLLWDGIFKEFKEVEMWQILLKRLVKMMLMQLYWGVVWKQNNNLPRKSSSSQILQVLYLIMLMSPVSNKKILSRSPYYMATANWQKT